MNRGANFWNVFVVSLLSLCYSSTATAKVYNLTPNDDWFSVIGGNSLKPGDRVFLATGVYSNSRRLVIGHRGTQKRPIVIAAAPGAKPVLRRPDRRQNSINIIGAQYLVLRDLEITGGDSGIRIMKSGSVQSKFVTIENLHIHHIGGVAITANNADNFYEGMIFRRNHIHHTGGHGEGFYLGVNNKADGSTAGYIFNSLVEGNYIHDLKGPYVSQGDGIEIKDGSYNNIIRDNVIHDTNYPGIIVYGTDGKAPNLVERNVIWNSGDHGIQAAADALIRNNIIYQSAGDGIYSRAHQSARIGNLQILYNTVVSNRSGGAAVRIALSGQKELTGPVVIANNALYAAASGFALRVPRQDAARGKLTVAGNVGAGAADGLPRNTARSAWNPSGRLDKDLDQAKFPRNGSTLLGVAHLRFAIKADFNGTPRGKSRDVGAYVFHPKGNPGWTISTGFKKRAPRR